MKKSMLVLLFLSLVHSGHAMADLKRDEAIALLRSAKAETSLTDKEKLGRYRCDMIRKYLGFKDTLVGQARKYSCDEPAIGIVFYAGDDLGEHSPHKIGEYFKTELAKHRATAKVFIQENWPHGSSMGFYTNGESLLSKAIRPSKAVEDIEFLAAEALLILYTEKRITKWPDKNP